MDVKEIREGETEGFGWEGGNEADTRVGGLDRQQGKQWCWARVEIALLFTESPGTSLRGKSLRGKWESGHMKYDTFREMDALR